MDSEPYSNLPIAKPDEFLPPIGRWSTLGGLALLLVFGGSISLAAILQYKTSVSVSATVRPEGDRQWVEATTQGKVKTIAVKPNDPVQKGSVIAILTDEELKLDQKQIQSNLDQTNQQLQGIQTQLLALDAEIIAEKRATERTIEASRSRLNLLERDYQDQQLMTQTDAREAEAAVRFAQEELDRYERLANTGALSILAISEKKAALEVALARQDRSQGLLDPSRAAIEQIKQEIAQTLATGEATLARLKQDKESILRQEIDLQKEIKSSQQRQEQLHLDLEKLTIRSPVNGIIQELNLGNPGQVVEVGEVIAEIIPAGAALTIQAQVNQDVISKVKVGQLVSIRIDSCVYTDYGILRGKVSQISPDAKQDPGVIGSYYEVVITPEGFALNYAGKICQLQPGMEGRADIITQEETLLFFWMRRLRLLTDL